MLFIFPLSNTGVYCLKLISYCSLLFLHCVDVISLLLLSMCFPTCCLHYCFCFHVVSHSSPVVEANSRYATFTTSAIFHLFFPLFIVAFVIFASDFHNLTFLLVMVSPFYHAIWPISHATYQPCLLLWPLFSSQFCHVAIWEVEFMEEFLLLELMNNVLKFLFFSRS